MYFINSNKMKIKRNIILFAQTWLFLPNNITWGNCLGELSNSCWLCVIELFYQILSTMMIRQLFPALYHSLLTNCWASLFEIFILCSLGWIFQFIQCKMKIKSIEITECLTFLIIDWNVVLVVEFDSYFKRFTLMKNSFPR